MFQNLVRSLSILSHHPISLRAGMLTQTQTKSTTALSTQPLHVRGNQAASLDSRSCSKRRPIFDLTNGSDPGRQISHCSYQTPE